MPIDRKDLDARIAAATKDDTVRGLIFNAVFDTVEEHFGKAAAIELDPTGKARRTDFFTYPVADFLKLAFSAAERLEPKLGSPDAGFHTMGHRSAASTLGSMVGRTILALAGTDRVRTLLGSAAAGYKATVSYGERKLEWLGPRHGRFTFRRDFLVPSFHCGVFQAAVEAVHGKNVVVEGKQVAPLDAVYEIRWEA
jgi:uncharacterized protein (TIGR02265 family)